MPTPQTAAPQGRGGAPTTSPLHPRAAWGVRSLGRWAGPGELPAGQGAPAQAPAMDKQPQTPGGALGASPPGRRGFGSSLKEFDFPNFLSTQGSPIQSAASEGRVLAPLLRSVPLRGAELDHGKLACGRWPGRLTCSPVSVPFEGLGQAMWAKRGNCRLVSRPCRVPPPLCRGEHGDLPGPQAARGSRSRQ